MQRETRFNLHSLYPPVRLNPLPLCRGRQERYRFLWTYGVFKSTPSMQRETLKEP